MSETQAWRALDPEQVRSLAAQLIETAPVVLRSADPDAALTLLGWTAREPCTWYLLVADVPLPITATAKLALDDGEVTQVLVPITDVVLGNDRDAVAFRQDAFANAAPTLTGVYGPPTTRTPGAEPTLVWQIGEVSVRLHAGQTAVDLMVERTADRERIEREDAADELFNEDGDGDW